jgi:Predicted kinase related to dihydroxyacetone kinase
LAILYVGAKRFQRGIQAGAEWVLKNRDHLNDINVFPVPDGDTGTNMSMTLAAAVRAMDDLKEVTLETTVKATAWGAMMGARGNSGIILAQILSGFAQAMEGRDRLSAEDIALGFSYAVGKAYKALLHPAEGTILTVVRETAEAAKQTVTTDKDLAILFNVMVRTARSSVEKTPLLLPRLKEAGVVDAGGLGFFYFLEGMLRLIYGTLQEGIEFNDETTVDEIVGEPLDHNWKNRFCTEFILKKSHISEDVFKASLVEMGDSIVVVGDSRLARIHIHTAEPEAVLRYAAGFGQVSSIKVDDMLVQHTSRFVTNGGSKASSVVAIVLGSGLREVFYNAGAELVVEGGPTHNPSTAEIMTAIESVASSNVIVLPNHKNVYPAAVQAAERAPKKITVLKTSSVPE